jgi:hypothetical protein
MTACSVDERSSGHAWFSSALKVFLDLARKSHVNPKPYYSFAFATTLHGRTIKGGLHELSDLRRAG